MFYEGVAVSVEDRKERKQSRVRYLEKNAASQKFMSRTVNIFSKSILSSYGESRSVIELTSILN